MMLIKDKKINYKFIIIIIAFFNILSLNLIFNFKSKTIVNLNNSITDYEVQLTYYYPGDKTGTGKTTGSGKTVSEFKVGENNWYFYEQNGVDYLVVAAATTYCRDAANHCGVSVDKHGMATTIPYYKYNDTLTLDIGGKEYNAIVMDSCGACMWGDRDTLGEKIDIFTTPNGVNPAIYQSSITGSNSNITTGNNAVNNFTTTYDGDIKKGYIYKRQKGNALILSKKDTDDTIVKKIDSIIKKIFKNTGRYSSGAANSGDYELVIPEGSRDALNWKQYDSNWGSIKLGSKGETIKKVGCLATSVAIQIKLSGTQVNSENFNPGTWVQYLNKHGGFSGSLFNWSDTWLGLAPNWHLVDARIYLPKSKEEKIRTIKQYLDQGYYPIMTVKKSEGHWVAVTGVTNDNVLIADPGSAATTAWPKYEVTNTTRMAIFKKND